jgi:hypothetical protein
MLPVCDHYSGVEARMRKSLQLQAEMTAEFGACVFDVTLDCEDGAPVGGEADHAALVTELALEAAPGARGRTRASGGPPGLCADVATIAGRGRASADHIMVPKVESVDDVALAVRALDDAGARHLPAACADRIARPPCTVLLTLRPTRGCSPELWPDGLCFGPWRRHPATACLRRASSPTRWWCAPSWRSPRPAMPMARCLRTAW